MIVLAKKSGLTSLISFNFMAKKAKKKLMKNEDHQQKDVDSYEFEMQIALSGDCTVANAPEAIIGTRCFLPPHNFRSLWPQRSVEGI
jgi:hypothetical protein